MQEIANTYVGNIDTNSLIEYIIRSVSNDEETNKMILYGANTVFVAFLKNITD